MSEFSVIVCPNCMQKYRVAPGKLGMRAVCKRCGQRFKLDAEVQVDDDTVCGWISQADAAGTSVMGGTSIFEAPRGQAAPTSAKWRRAAPPSEPRIRFVRVDKEGACFEFPVALLLEDDLRASFPHRCSLCLNPRDLSLHMLIWGDKLPRKEALLLQEAENRVVRSVDKLMAADPDSWFKNLEPVVVLPKPFSNPFPYSVCSNCSPIGAVKTHLRTESGLDYCQVCIANLTVALDFYRNNGGRGEPGYQRLLIARRQQKDNQWENLPFVVRTRVSTWFTKQSDERFLGFYSDEDFGRADTGLAGLVLTDRRIVYKKYAACCDYPISRGGQLVINANQNRATVELSQAGCADAICQTRPLVAGALARTLTELSPKWQIEVHTGRI